jgi:N-hydroxyarylamine O-acetyltransferase
MTDVQSYLARVGYKGSTSPTRETLRAIHYAHLLNVPFENLDIALGRKIALDEDSFIRKIAERRRGGFCYELNGAFAALLRALGFRVTVLSARGLPSRISRAMRSAAEPHRRDESSSRA